ncbi:MAG: methyltransferase domain-containing protein, partial [Rhodospirillaceae bacterium]|nr:methyltransferase domain-containing protein [Rhodospirillaceae bacterium]
MSGAADEIRRGERFAFGANWARFLRTLDGERIARAERALKDMLECERLDGLRFLDAGCGSGLSSLAARRLGATVHSFDYDPQAVACARELKRRHFPGDDAWTVEQGSVLDGAYLAGLGRFDIVYSWGVLHHTGALWQALEAVVPLVAEGGRLFVAIYNDEGGRSRRWARVKRAYNRHPRLRPALLAYGLARTWGMTLLLDLCRLRPFRTWRGYRRERGMSPWPDLVDWVGGWPYEVATPEAIFRFYRDRGFVLENLVTR